MGYTKKSLTGRKDLSPEARFWARVEKTDTCWLWQGQRNNQGYGGLKVQGVEVKAHRFAYELLVGPIPDGLVIDHTCLVKHCVRPEHLQPLTQAENARVYFQEQRDLCRNKLHDMKDPANRLLWSVYGKPSVRCKACNDARVARRKASQVASRG